MSLLYLLPTDGHGSTRQLINTLAGVVETYNYDAYGVMTGPDNPLTSILYSGEMTDRTGLQYLRARYYDPSTGRFNTLDPFAGRAGEPISLHKYLYAGASPVMYSDPTGQFFVSFVDILASGSLQSLMASMQAGTGRILMNQVMYGAKAGLVVSAVEAAISVASWGLGWVVGAAIGEVASYIGGKLAPVISKVMAEIAKDSVRVFRVEGSVNARILVNDAGQVAVQNMERTLFLNFGSRARAVEFLEKRLSQGMTDASIKSFEVPRQFLDDLRDAAIPEALARQYPNAPISVDLTKAPDQFGLRPEQIEQLVDAIIQGTGKIEWF